MLDALTVNFLFVCDPVYFMNKNEQTEWTLLH